MRAGYTVVKENIIAAFMRHIKSSESESKWIPMLSNRVKNKLLLHSS